MNLTTIGIRRILMTTDTIGGVWSYALELCRALGEYRIEVVLATMGYQLTPEQKQAARRLPNVGIYESDYKLEWMQSPWKDVQKAGEWLLSLESSVRPDIVHLNGYVHGSLPWRSPVLVVGHSCVYSWFCAVKGIYPPKQWRRYHREVTRGLRGADFVTAPTSTMLDCLNTHYGGFFARPPIYNSRLPEDFPVRSKKPIVLTAGRLWDEAKNAAIMQEVAPKISWPVVMAGDCRHPDGSVRQLDGITCPGFLDQPEIARYMGQAAIFISPARYEPFGLAPLEAALAGCALILGDIPSLREIWRDTALYVPTDDPSAIRTAIQELINKPDIRRRYAFMARERALSFTPDRMVRQYLHMYYEMLGHQETTNEAYRMIKN